MKIAAKAAALWIVVNVAVGVYVGVGTAFSTPDGQHALSIMRGWFGF